MALQLLIPPVARSIEPISAASARQDSHRVVTRAVSRSRSVGRACRFGGRADQPPGSRARSQGSTSPPPTRRSLRLIPGQGRRRIQARVHPLGDSRRRRRYLRRPRRSRQPDRFPDATAITLRRERRTRPRSGTPRRRSAGSTGRHRPVQRRENDAHANAITAAACLVDTRPSAIGSPPSIERAPESRGVRRSRRVSSTGTRGAHRDALPCNENGARARGATGPFLDPPQETGVMMARRMLAPR